MAAGIGGNLGTQGSCHCDERKLHPGTPEISEVSRVALTQHHFPSVQIPRPLPGIVVETQQDLHVVSCHGQGAHSGRTSGGT